MAQADLSGVLLVTVPREPAITASPFLGGLAFGEGPRWHDARLWYSDLYDRGVWSVGEDGEDLRREAELGCRPSGLGWLPDEGLLVAAMTARAVLRRRPDGTLVPHADLSRVEGFAVNDMVVDGRGRAYVGCVGFDLEGFFEKRSTATTAPVLRVDPDGSVHVAAPDLSLPNGMVLCDGGRTLVVAETFGGRLSAFDVGAAGELSRRRVWAELGRCSPDGICLDAEGAIWVADAASTACLRVGEGGQVLQRVGTTQRCFACALGGADGRTLFCMTAPTSRAAKLVERRDGLVERARVGVPGAPGS